MNVGLIAGVGYAFYSKPHLRSNTKAITTTAAAALTIVLGEGCAAEQYLSRTPEGQSALRRAKEKRHWLANYINEFVARTNPYKGAVGICKKFLLFSRHSLTRLGSEHRDRGVCGLPCLCEPKCSLGQEGGDCDFYRTVGACWGRRASKFKFSFVVKS